MSAEQTNAPAVLITGTSTGIGEACAVALHERGMRVFAGVRRLEDGERLVDATSNGVTPIMLDVTDAAAIANAASTIRDATGDAGLAGLVNNAGVTVAFPLEFLPVEELRRQLEINTIGPAAVTQSMLPLLRLPPGRVVNVSSVSGLIAAPYIGAYAASKHALEALSDSLRVEVRNFGISVSLIEPADIKTPIWEKSRAAADELREQMMAEVDDDSVSDDVREVYAADITAMRAATQKFAAAAIPVERVVRAVVHAL
ncbi:MAG: SDR family NAD(P)-dependent oxidoreductase, partial [Pirellulaceae bacterium]|nr:SDR family NAD(P)-dependent oxidoreductase [Pirellulaceae bacterium]